MLSKLNSGVLLGEGTFGKVFLGNDGETAVKIAKDVESSRSIHGEFDVLRKLNHANVIKVHQLNVEVGISFFAMELMDNNLSSFLRQNTRVRLELVENFSKQLFNALHYLAEMSIIHRDVKPSNILVKNPLKLKLSDFGTAIHVESKDRNCGVTTLGYRAPEMILQDKSYGLPVDVWSMGCVVVKMLTGKELFPNRQQNGDEKAQLKAIDEGLLQLDTGICGSSSWLRKILHNTLQMDPHTRWTAYEVLGATLSNSKRPAAEISKVAASDASLLDKYISELQLQNRHDYEEASRTKFEGRISSTETSPDFFLVKVLTASDCGTRITAGTHFDITTMNGVQVLGEVTAIGDDLCNKTISLKIPVSSLPSLPQFAAPPAVCTLQQRYDPTTFDRKLNAVMTAKTRLANDHLTSLKAALLGFSAIVTSPLVVSALFNDTHTNRLHQKQAEALSCALQHKISLIHGPVR